MKDIFDVIVIGGGVYGTACSYFLKDTKNKVLLIERGKVGSLGATSYSRGIARVYDPDIDLRKLSMDSIMDFLNWDENKFPGHTPYTSSGFLYLLNESEISAAERFCRDFSQKAYPIEVLSPQKIQEMFPWIKKTDTKIGIYEKKGGFGEPTLTAANFANGFKANGGELYENCEVQSIDSVDGLWEVKLYGQNLKARVVLVTAGAYAKQVVPTLPLFTRSISLTQMISSKAEVNISVVDEEVETYLRPGDGASFYCGSQVFDIVDHPYQLQPSNDDEVKDSIRRLDALLQLSSKEQTINAMKGFDGYTEQKKPIVQFLQDREGLYVATGFSGRGYKCCIAVSKSIARQINSQLAGKPVINDIKWRVLL